MSDCSNRLKDAKDWIQLRAKELEEIGPTGGDMQSAVEQKNQLKVCVISKRVPLQMHDYCLSVTREKQRHTNCTRPTKVPAKRSRFIAGNRTASDGIRIGARLRSRADVF